MKKLTINKNLNYMAILLCVGVVLLGVVSLLVSIGSSVFAWGPERPTYVMEKPAKHVVFNSMTNQKPYGDERNFFRVREATTASGGYVDSINVQPGKEYEFYIHYHNNASVDYNSPDKGSVGIAKNAKVKVNQGWTIKANQKLKVQATISADNAKPKEVWDDAFLSSSTDVALRYVPGSATIYNKGKSNGAKLPDSLFAAGTFLGYDALDGALPGCNEFSGYIKYKVVVDQPNFTLKKQVRLNGTKEWKDGLKAQPGQKVDYLISYKNTGTMIQNNVTIKDILPKYVDYQKGTTKLQNASKPNGELVADGVTTNGINVGNYAANSNANVAFTATLPQKDKLSCGPNKLINIAEAKTENGTKQNRVDVTVDVECKPDECKPGIPEGDERCDDPKECKPGIPEGDERCNDTPVALPHAGPLSIAGSVLAIAAVVLGATYYIKSKKHKNKLATNTDASLEEDKETKFVKKEEISKTESTNSSDEDTTPQE